ncbi:hypothetical protein GW755_02150 [bacterium]|nr:hypothetical protein [bacterium]
MKKYLTLTIGFIIVLLGVGYTYSVFSDTERIDNNTLSSATVDITLQALTSGIIEKPVNVSNLVPTQWTDWARAEIYNEDYSTSVRVFMYLENTSGLLCDEVNLQVTTGVLGTNTAERGTDIYLGPIVDLEGVSNKVEVTSYVSQYLGITETMAIQQRAQIDENATNDVQGETCTWDEVFVAETPVY